MKLKRIARTAEATYGVLLHMDVPFAVTLERPWLNNERGKSCIPAGTYQCSMVKSPKFGVTWQVNDVPGRSAILFHKGNISDDSHGCILVGEAFNPVNGKPGITASKEGFEEFMRLTSGMLKFHIRITEAF